MEKIRFAVVGSGWRSKFYIRVAKTLNKQFELTSMLFRSEEKANKFKDEFNINVTTSKMELLNTRPHFVVIAVDKQSIFKVTKEFLEHGIPVLAETPAGLSIKDLNELWKLHTEEKLKLQIAEQYHLYPYYQGIIKEVKSKKIGKVEFVSISSVHDYHSASLFRLLLGLNYENFSINGKIYNYLINETNSRNGLITEEKLSEKVKKVITIEFETGQTVFHNFSSEQYHSLIRSRNLLIEGDRGEINNNKIKYLDKNYVVQNQEIKYNLNKKLPDDETAISKCLMGMYDYITTEKEFYPLSYALQDAYISLLMEKAINTGKVIKSETQIWGMNVKEKKPMPI